MLIQLTVGKVDAGVAVLLTEDKRLIEFPSILLPASITSGSIVDITVSQNGEAEKKSRAAFADLQSRILNTYGLSSPSPPTLRLRGATQTSLVLEWDPLELATSNLKSLCLYRNGSKAGSIPRPLEMMSTKISGLAVDTEYSFHLVLKTTAGTYSSPVLTCRTHKMTELSGITVTPGVLPEPLRASLETAVKRIGGRIVDTVRIDTTHFVCIEGRGKEWERAEEMNIPVVRPEWVEGCEREGKLVGVRGYYLDANPKDRQVGSNPSIADQVATGPLGTQTGLPHRAPQHLGRSESYDKNSHTAGQGNGLGPGPMAERNPPTPPAKSSQPPSQPPPPGGAQQSARPYGPLTTAGPVSPPASVSSASGPTLSDNQAEEAGDVSEPDEEDTHAPSKASEKKKTLPRRTEASMKAKLDNVDEDDDEEEEEEEEGEDGDEGMVDGHGHGQMDDVPL